MNCCLNGIYTTPPPLKSLKSSKVLVHVLSIKNESNPITQAQLSTYLNFVRFEPKWVVMFSWIVSIVAAIIYLVLSFVFPSLTLFHYILPMILILQSSFSFFLISKCNSSISLLWFIHKLHHHTVYLLFQAINETQFNWQNRSWLNAINRKITLHWNMQLTRNINIHLQLPCLIFGAHAIIIYHLLATSSC